VKFVPPAATASKHVSPALSNELAATSPPLAAPLPAAASPAVSQGDIGSPGPVSVLAASPSASWVALCQGEPKVASLVLGSGIGETVDAVLAHDATGRYVVVQRGAQVSLIDATTGTRVDLSARGADARRAKQDYRQHRALSFDAGGQHLAYLRRQGTQTQVVVRNLASGSERSFSPGGGEVFQLRLSADARYVVLDVLRDDTTRNGKLDWPVPEEKSERACSDSLLPKLRSYAYWGRGDAVTRAVISLADGALRDLPELVIPLGTRLLVRETDGSLRLDLGGKRSAFAPAACAGRVLFADAEREQALVTCVLPKKPGKREVWLFANGYAKSLQSELYETSIDRDAVLGVRLVPLYAGSEAALVDLERREVVPLTAGSRVVQTNGVLALLWRGSELFSYDSQSKREQRLAQGVLRNPDLLETGAAALVSPFVVLGAAAPALASPTLAPLAIASSGHVLSGSLSAEPAAGAAIQGPLHWLDARLPPPDGPPR
jgi:hypothetical protein